MLADRDAEEKDVCSSSSSNSRGATGVFGKPDNRSTINAFIDSIQSVNDDFSKQ